MKEFGYGKLDYPKDIYILFDTIYMYLWTTTAYTATTYNLPEDELTRQEQLMTVAVFFTVDKNGNVLIISRSIHRLTRIFSPKEF